MCQGPNPRTPALAAEARARAPASPRAVDVVRGRRRMVERGSKIRATGAPGPTF